MPTEKELYDKIRSKCWDTSFHSFAFGYVFDKRSQRFGKRINWLKVFGLLVPAIVGSTVIAYGLKNVILPYMIDAAVLISVIQFTFSVLAIIYKWDDELSYAFEASQSYNTLWDRFRKLGETPPEDIKELERQYDLLKVEYISRNQQDTKHNIHEWEVRKGHRASLREFQKVCVGCGKTPTSIKSTNCDVCGNFNYTLLKK